MPSALARGLAFYAEKQAGVFEGLAARCANAWIPFLKSTGATPAWTQRYSVIEAKGKGVRGWRGLRAIREELDSDTDDAQFEQDEGEDYDTDTSAHDL